MYFDIFYLVSLKPVKNSVFIKINILCFVPRHEAMVDLVHILGSLVDTHGNIKVPGIHDSVKALTEEEKVLYKDIEFSVVCKILYRIWLYLMQQETHRPLSSSISQQIMMC